MVGAPFEECVVSSQRPRLRRLLEECMTERRTADVMVRGSGDTAAQHVKLIARPLTLPGAGLAVFLLAINLDKFWILTDRLRHEKEELEIEVAERTAALQAAVADKEMLLQEVHHRTKNNLQMLCDLLYLQMEAPSHRDPRSLLQDAYTRIYVIAKLHEQLYQSLDTGRVSLGTYLERVATGLQALHEGVPVRVEVTGQEPLLDVDRAIHAGLMVNELLTNAAKHAFSDGARGETGVRIGTDGDRVELQVWDTGKGMPPDFDLERADSLGLRIVRILARRLGASVQVENAGGTLVSIAFPLAPEPAAPQAEESSG
jgi:two-component sensor histidine kinase